MRQPQPRKVSEANKPFGRGPRSGRAVWYPPPLGRAEQRSSVRIKALALFERSEFASAPNAASSARNPKGTDVARLFFGYFFLATQKKVTRLPGRNPACPRRAVNPATQTPQQNPFFAYFLSATQKKVTRLPGRNPACPRRDTKPAPQTSQISLLNQTYLSSNQSAARSFPTSASPGRYLAPSR